VRSPARARTQAALPARGGETAALARLQHYLWGTDAARTYFDTRNGMLGPDFSTKFSPWLAAGCLSARRVAAEVERCAAAGPQQERGLACMPPDQILLCAWGHALGRRHSQALTGQDCAHILRVRGACSSARQARVQVRRGARRRGQQVDLLDHLRAAVARLLQVRRARPAAPGAGGARAPCRRASPPARLCSNRRIEQRFRVVGLGY